VTADELARLFHETYERLAPSFGYETRRASAVPWEQVPAANRALMIAVASHVLERIEFEAQVRQAEVMEDALDAAISCDIGGYPPGEAAMTVVHHLNRLGYRIEAAR
jgi:hypothetical protein